MLDATDQMIMTAMTALTGGAVFLRLVAKEKRRREKHLEYRLHEQIEEQERAARDPSGANSRLQRRPVHLSER